MQKHSSSILSLLLCITIAIAPTLSAMEVRRFYGIEKGCKEDEPLLIKKSHQLALDECYVDMPLDTAPLGRLFTENKHRDISCHIASYLMQNYIDSFFKPIWTIPRKNPIAATVGLFDDEEYITLYNIPALFINKKELNYLTKFSLPSGNIKWEQVVELTVEEVEQLSELGYSNSRYCYKLTEEIEEGEFIENWFRSGIKSKEPVVKSSDQYNADLGALISPNGMYAAIENEFGLSVWNTTNLRLKRLFEGNKNFRVIDYIRLQELTQLIVANKGNSVAAKKLWNLLNNISDTAQMNQIFTLQPLPTLSCMDQIYSPANYKKLIQFRYAIFGMLCLNLLNCFAATLSFIFMDKNSAKIYFYTSFASCFITFGMIMIIFGFPRKIPGEAHEI